MTEPKTERFEPVVVGSPLDRLLRQHAADSAAVDVRELAKDLEFVIDVTEPREQIIERFQWVIEQHLARRTRSRSPRPQGGR